MLSEDKKEFVKMRVKASYKRHWKRNFKDAVVYEEQRLVIYQKAWELRESWNSAIPNAKLIELLISELGHWDKKHHKGAKIYSS